MDLIQFQNEVYEIIQQDNLVDKIQCNKNKNGFKITITFSKDKEENIEAENAALDFLSKL